MSIISYPYTSVEGDRKVTASQMAEGFGVLATSGVSTIEDDLLCRKGAYGITVDPGKAFIAGHFVSVDALEPVPFVLEEHKGRTDFVVLESTNGTDEGHSREAFIKVVSSLTPGDTQIPLCSVFVPTVATSFENVTLTDMREFSYGKHKHLVSDIGQSDLGAISTIMADNLMASRALISNTYGKVAVSNVTGTELGYLSGVTYPIQTQLNAKQETITGAATTIDTEDLTASRALMSNTSGKVVASAVTSTELGYVSGVTSAIQTQLNAKEATLNADQKRKITISSSNPSGGVDGDIWLKYS